MGVISATSIAYRNAPTLKEELSTSTNTKRSSGFYSSIKSRQVVKQVVERIMKSAAFTFDYMCMLIVASLIAAGIVCVVCIVYLSGFCVICFG